MGVWSTLDSAPALLTAGAAIAVFVIGACSAVGAAFYLVTGGWLPQ